MKLSAASKLTTLFIQHLNIGSFMNVEFIYRTVVIVCLLVLVSRTLITWKLSLMLYLILKILDFYFLIFFVFSVFA